MARTRTKDYYAILGVERGASVAEIKAAFRRRSFEMHPDHNPSPDANRRMAELIEARNVLTDPIRRARVDQEILFRGGPRRTATGERRREEAQRTAGAQPMYRKAPAEGVGSIQPERLPDWYEFLGLRVTASSAEILTALRKMQAHLNGTNYAPDVEATLRKQVRQAAETLTNPAQRGIYDRAMAGEAPPAGKYPHLHPHWYSFLGVTPRASGDRIAERVTDLCAGLRKTSAEYQEITAAWKVLGNAERRAAYDETLRESAQAKV